MNPQLNKAVGHENIHVIPLQEGQMLKQEMLLQAQGSPHRTGHSHISLA